MDKSVFISHSSKDKDIVDDLLKHIEAAGVECWIAPRDITVGMPYAEEIVNAIAKCQVVLVVISANAILSEHVLNEIELAVNNTKVILPFKIDKYEYNDSYKYYLNRKHTIMAMPEPSEYFKELVASVKHLLSRTDNSPDTENDSVLISIRERNRNRLIKATKESRLSFGLSIATDNFADNMHYYSFIKRIDVIDTPNLKYSNYRWITIENKSDKPTKFIIHKECGDNKVRFSDMKVIARQLSSDNTKGELLDVDSLTSVQPNFEQVMKIHLIKDLLPGEEMRIFFKLDWPGEPGAYCDELSTSISLTRYPFGVGKLVFGVIDTVPLYGFEFQKVTAEYKTETMEIQHIPMSVIDDPDLKPLHGKINATGAYFELQDASDGASYRIQYKQRREDTQLEEDGF